MTAATLALGMLPGAAARPGELLARGDVCQSQLR